MMNSDGDGGYIDENVKLLMDNHPGCDGERKLEGQG
jgi:hypothetical protein